MGNAFLGFREPTEGVGRGKPGRPTSLTRRPPRSREKEEQDPVIPPAA